MTIDQIKRANAEAGFHWFEPQALRFFRSKVGRTVYSGPGGVYFVTSERYNDATPRLYSVRRVLSGGSVETAGDFQAYRSGRAARNAARKLAKG